MRADAPIIFTPKYRWEYYLTPVLMLPFLALAIHDWEVGAGSNAWLFLIPAGVIGLDLFVLLSWPRRIRFKSDRLVIERYLRGAKEILYTDVVDIGLLNLQARTGSVYWGQYSPYRNGEDLHGIITKLVDHNRIHPNQLEGKLLPKQQREARALFAAMVLALVVFVLSNLAGVWPHLPGLLNPLLVIILILVIYYLVY